MLREVTYDLHFLEDVALYPSLSTPRNAALAEAQAMEHERSLVLLGDEFPTLTPAEVEHFLCSIVPESIGNSINNFDS
ncbi:hypothetical protein NDU88_006264 [Pleurodeles waltl]|uniref:Uncharacterized protein n=1 Tax=Pleurodeles waltl TaxID=8319 RepID=A0AAV7TCW5_PLEWA|nr:hypothetical protein NDU88_006264 [Pleurodeles waltl]